MTRQNERNSRVDVMHPAPGGAPADPTPASRPAGRGDAERGENRKVDVAPRDAGAAAPMVSWPKTRQPMIFRVPPGYVLVAGVALLAGMAMTFMTGYGAGYVAGKSHAQRVRSLAEQSLVGVRSSPMPPAAAATVTVGGVASSAESAASWQDPFIDTRTPGRYYLVLAQYPEPDAVRLVRFLRSYNVDAMILGDPDGGLLKIVDRRGFTPAEHGDGTFRKYRRVMVQLGALWHDHHEGPSDFFGAWAEGYRIDEATGLD